MAVSRLYCCFMVFLIRCFLLESFFIHITFHGQPLFHSQNESGRKQDHKEIKSLTNEVKSLRKENTSLHKEVSFLKQKNAAITEECSKLRNENSLLRNDNERMKRILNNDSSNSSDPPSKVSFINSLSGDSLDISEGSIYNFCSSFGQNVADL